MPTTVKVICVTMVVILALATSAAAADICFSNSGGELLVGKGFGSLPAKNACKEFRGFFLANPAHGQACGNADGVHVTISVVSASLSGASTLAIQIERATGAGTRGTFCSLVGPGSTCSSGHILSRIPCNPANVPIPD